MCPECQGLGEAQEFLLNLIIDEKKSLSEDCCSIAGLYQTIYNRNVFDNLASLFHFSVDTPWKDLPEKVRRVLLYGDERRWIRNGASINPNTGSMGLMSNGEASSMMQRKNITLQKAIAISARWKSACAYRSAMNAKAAA